MTKIYFYFRTMGHSPRAALYLAKNHVAGGSIGFVPAHLAVR